MNKALKSMGQRKQKSTWTPWTRFDPESQGVAECWSTSRPPPDSNEPWRIFGRQNPILTATNVV